MDDVIVTMASISYGRFLNSFSFFRRLMVFLVPIVISVAIYQLIYVPQAGWCVNQSLTLM